MEYSSSVLQRSRNLGLAAKAMTAFVVLSEASMLAFADISIHVMFVFLLDFPILIFFLVFFFGQHLTCGVWGPNFWLDRLCVDQTDAKRKAEGIAGLPTIVANSSELLVLWDKSYYQRLLRLVSSRFQWPPSTKHNKFQAPA